MADDPRPRDLDVRPTPVRGSAGGRRGVAGVLAVAGIVILGAIASAQLAPVPGTAPPPVVASPPSVVASPPSVVAPPPGGGSEPPSGPSAGQPAGPADAISRRLGRAALASAVRDGSLEDRLVFVDGVLRVTPARCQGPARGSGGCVDLAIPGVGVPVSQGEPATPWPGAPPAGAWLVTVARDGGLVYLGSLVPAPAGPATITDLRIGGQTDRVGSLLEVRGYLVVNPAHPCDRRDPAATPCPSPSPFLADDEPLPDGVLVSDAGEAVVLMPSLPGVDPAAVVTEGTFLVRRARGDGVGWEVVARYEPSRSVRALVP